MLKLFDAETLGQGLVGTRVVPLDELTPRGSRNAALVALIDLAEV